MAVVPGRGTDARTITFTSTSSSTAITGAAGTFQLGDAGRVLTATGITAGTTISAVASGTAATLSAVATTTGARSGVIAQGADGGTAYGYRGWSPESDAEAATHIQTAGDAGSPSLVTAPNVRRLDNDRSR